MLRVLGKSTSINVRKVLWLCSELSLVFMSLVRKDPAYSDATMVDSSVEAWNKNMVLLDDQISKSGKFVVGVDFTLADIVLGLATHRWLSTPIDKPNLPAVQVYYQQLCQREGFVQHGCNGIP